MVKKFMFALLMRRKYSKNLIRYILRAVVKYLKIIIIIKKVYINNFSFRFQLMQIMLPPSCASCVTSKSSKWKE